MTKFSQGRDRTLFQDAVAEIESRPDRPGDAGGFESAMAAFAEITGFPIDGRGVVVIAGTNGKGSTAKMLETLLRSAGKRVGLYTSPHLEKITERICIDGRPLTETEFASTFTRVRELCLRRNLGRFEILTAMAIDAFYSDVLIARVDCAIFEVGVGGRLDCVNAIPHELAAVARLGLDHEAALGNGLGAIAREKFAIARTARACAYLAPLETEAECARISEAEKSRVEWHAVSAYPLAAVGRDERGDPVFSINTPWGITRIALAGERGAENASLALTCFKLLGEDPVLHARALADVAWPGRMERLPSRCARGSIYLSGDHNPQGARSLAQLLRHWRYDRVHLVVGIAANKDARAIIAELEKIPRAQMTFAKPPFRGADPASYGRGDAVFHSDPMVAIEYAEAAAHSVEDLIVITGSLYLVGAARAGLMSRSASGRN